MSADSPAQRSEILEFLSALFGICVFFAFFGTILAFFPVIDIGIYFGNQAALNAISIVVLIVAVGSLVVTWKWGNWGSRSHQDVAAATTQTASSSEDRPAQVLPFTASDLELNGKGRTSTAQRLRLLEADLGWLILAILCFGEASSLALISRSAGWEPNVLTGLKGTVLVLLGVGWGIWALVRAGKGGVDSLRGRVTGERTRLSPHREQSWAGNTVYRLRTENGHELRVLEDVFDAVSVSPQTRYLVHFAPLSQKLISLE